MPSSISISLFVWLARTTWWASSELYRRQLFATHIETFMCVYQRSDIIIINIQSHICFICSCTVWDKAWIGLFGDLLHFIQTQENTRPVETICIVCFISTWKVNGLSQGPHRFPSAKWYSLRFKTPYICLMKFYLIKIISLRSIIKEIIGYKWNYSNC